MNWKPSFSKCLVVLLGFALVGCGSAADHGAGTTSTETPGSETTSDSDLTLVTLELPGMT